ncbi:uncharacterized protein METZ01_LOCUS849 [marine metagenome]|uniref:Uncharacterized protein n=1 Tax=marine metagenome TaxID=408172 RepID=A0A381N0F6_9ZZZZ
MIIFFIPIDIVKNTIIGNTNTKDAVEISL